MKAPAFQFYAGDYFIDTFLWSNRELGAYTRLLSFEWSNGPLPSSMTELAKIACETRTQFVRIWDKISYKFETLFDTNLGQFEDKKETKYYINSRLEKTREKQSKYSESRRIGANAKHKKDSAYAEHMQVHTPCSPSPSPTPSQILLKEYATFTEKWWQTYPSRNGKKVGKRESLIYLKAMKLMNGNRELLLKATENYSNSKAALEGFAKDPIRFLKKDFWRDWIEPEPEQQKDWC